jgi:hypothetical protein
MGNFLRYASDRFFLDEAEHFLHNRDASVATLRWCSGSSRDAVRIPSGMSVQLRRNPQPAPHHRESCSESTHPPVSLGPPAYLCFVAFLSRLSPSAARRFAVRLSAATVAAFLARAVRSSGVMFFAAVLPPCLPNFRAISAIAARISAGIFKLIPSIVHLTGYGGVSREMSDRAIDSLWGKLSSERDSGVRFVRGIEH